MSLYNCFKNKPAEMAVWNLLFSDCSHPEVSEEQNACRVCLLGCLQ